MFLLVTLSAPIIKTIYLLKIELPGGATVANAGVLGICYKGGKSTSVVHFTSVPSIPPRLILSQLPRHRLLWYRGMLWTTLWLHL